MKKMLLVLTLLAAASMVGGQQTRTEITTATNINDSQPNSAAVPDVYAITGQFKSVMMLRFKYQTDLLAGLEDMVRKHKIRNAVILSGIGSVRGYRVHVVSNRTFPSKNMFLQDSSAPADLIGMNGYVIDGRVHAHITLANPEKAFGGHLESGTEVFTFAVVTLGVLGDDTDLNRIDEKNYR